MSTQLKLRRGTTAQHSTFTGASGEVTVDTTKKTVVVHDGTTAGGVPLAKESQLTSPNVSFQQSIAGAVTRTVDDKLKETVSVADFGASPSASASVNTAAFNNAIASGRELLIPAGTYDLNPLVIEDIIYLTIRGQGRVKLRFTSGTSAITLGDAAHTKPVRRVIFDNLDITCSGAITYAINMQNAIDCSFYDVKIQDPSTLINTGVYIKWSWDNNFYNLIVLSLNGVVFTDQANTNTIFGGRFESTNSSLGVGIRGEYGTANACIGCDVSSWKYGYSIGGVSGFIIQGNYFEGNTENDIYFNANAPASGVVIEGNFFDDRTTPINAIKQEPNGGVNGSSGVVVRGNSFYGPPLNYFIIMNLNCYNWSVGANDFKFSSNRYSGTDTAIDCHIEGLYGTWTPTYRSASGTPTTSQSSGRWVKNGRTVTAWFHIKGAAGTGTGALYISGLPFKGSAGVDGYGFVGAKSTVFGWGSGKPDNVAVTPNNTNIALWDANANDILVSNMATSGNEIIGSVTYQSDV